MKILQYQGVSPISKAIRWQTRDNTSHTALLEDDGSVWEAWHKGGVAHNESISSVHTPGTKVKVYSLKPEYLDCFGESTALKFLEAQEGKGYDFSSVLRFLSRRDAPKNNLWFCSELALTYFQKGCLPLLRGNPSQLSPRDVNLSTRIQYEDTWYTE